MSTVRAMARPRAHLLVAVLILSALLGVSSRASASPVRASGSTSVQAFMTLYGYVDNSPSGMVIAHPCIHQGAGGTGTYDDPITFATDVSELPWCTIIYVPYMERYFIHEDECSQCDQSWDEFHRYRFDMWAGGDAQSLVQPERRALLRCESTWTRADSINDSDNPSIMIDPPAGLPVMTAPIFSAPTTCWQPISMGNPGKQTSVRASAVDLQVTASDSSPGETLSYRAVGLPDGLSINPGSGLISGTPTARRRAHVTVTAADTYNAASVRFIWSVRNAP